MVANLKLKLKSNVNKRKQLRARSQTVEISDRGETGKQPESGEPSNTAMPWNRTVSPNAFVSF